MSAASTDFKRMFSPRSIAIVGASQNFASFGGRVTWTLLRHGFAGSVVAVNPRYSQVQGLPCYPNVRSLPEPVDLAIYAVGADQVTGAVAESADKGIPFGIVLASGFAETGPVGVAAQIAMHDRAKGKGMRLLGPNCLGLVNIADNVAATPTGALDVPDLYPGGVSLVAQSGMLAFLSIFARGYEHGVGFRHVVSTGNEADITASELILALCDDPATTVIAAQLESIRDADVFHRAAHRAMEVGKPLIVFKSGRTEAGQLAAAAHTAALATSDAVCTGVFDGHGVIRADDLDVLWRLPALLMARAGGENASDGRCDAKGGVGVITTSGGLSGILADCLSAEGLQLAPLSEATKRAAQAVLPSYAVMGNPLDLTGYFDGAAQAIKTCIEAFDADPAVDTIVVAPGVPSADMYDIVASLRLAAAESATPLVLLTVGGKIVRAGLRGLHRSGLPWFDSPQACARALRLAKEWRRFGTDQIMDSTPYIAPVLRQIGTPRLLGYRDACTLLAECEAGEVVGDIAMSGDDSVRLAQQAGYPVVLKALTEAVPHKSDRGAVRLCLRAADDVRTADAELRDTFPDAEILVQPQVSGGVEVLVGLVCDEQFGPTVAVATGGSLVNVIDDKVLRLAPVSPTEARRMLDNLAGRAQLAGVRGRPSADVDALIDLIVAVAKLGAQHSEVIAIDLNPVLVLPVGQGVRIIDAKVWAVATGVNERVPT